MGNPLNPVQDIFWPRCPDADDTNWYGAPAKYDDFETPTLAYVLPVNNQIVGVSINRMTGCTYDNWLQPEISNWCVENLQGYWSPRWSRGSNTGYLLFTHEHDVIHFKLAWAEECRG